MLNIRSGPVARPQKVVIYGVEGIGKTTLAAQTPEPLFIDTEGGTAHLDVRRLEPANWEELLAMVNEVAATSGVCRTLVIDTADWAEAMAVEAICKKHGQAGLESFGYGKGYTYLSEAFARLLTACDRVIASGKHVVITAHARQRKVELPDETGSFDVWGLKLSKQCAPLLKEWPDALLFANYKTIVVDTGNNNRKAQGGKRVIYTNHRPTYDAKNRHGLADELPLSYDSIAGIFAGAPEPQPAPTPAAKEELPPVTAETLTTLREWMRRAGVQEDEVCTLVAMKGYFPPETPLDAYPEKFVRGWLMKNFGSVVKTIENNPEHVPF